MGNLLCVYVLLHYAVYHFHSDFDRYPLTSSFISNQTHSACSRELAPFALDFSFARLLQTRYLRVPQRIYFWLWWSTSKRVAFTPTFGGRWTSRDFTRLASSVQFFACVAAFLLEVGSLTEAVLSNQIAVVDLRIIHAFSSCSWWWSFARSLTWHDTSWSWSGTLVRRAIASNMHAFHMTSFMTASALCRAL